MPSNNNGLSLSSSLAALFKLGAFPSAGVAAGAIVRRAAAAGIQAAAIAASATSITWRSAWRRWAAATGTRRAAVAASAPCAPSRRRLAPTTAGRRRAVSSGNLVPSSLAARRVGLILRRVLDDLSVQPDAATRTMSPSPVARDAAPNAPLPAHFGKEKLG